MNNSWHTHKHIKEDRLEAVLQKKGLQHSPDKHRFMAVYLIASLAIRRTPPVRYWCRIWCEVVLPSRCQSRRRSCHAISLEAARASDGEKQACLRLSLCGCRSGEWPMSHQHSLELYICIIWSILRCEHFLGQNLAGNSSHPDLK